MFYISGARSVVNAQVRSASKRIYGIGPIKAILVRYRFLVGTAETTTTCPATFPKSFCEWLGGIIDGDGCLQVKNQKYPTLDITMGLEDLPLLR
jgi:hypothetical protein